MVRTLPPADRAILEHVVRYRLTTPAILAPTGLLPDAGIDAARRTLERLTADGWLVAAELVPESAGQVCYQLTARAAEQLGHDAEFAEPLARDVRIESFAVATFCCCGDVFRQLFTKAEFREKFRELWFPGQPVRYYLEPVASATARLAFLKVDKDGPGRWDRLIDSCARFLRQRIDATRVAPEHRARVEAFARLVQRGQFQFTVLTALPEKQRAIELELERRTLAKESVPPIRVHVVPGLFDVMFLAPH